MMMDIDKLSGLVAYDPETGLFTFKERCRSFFASDRSFKVWNTRFSGQPAMNVITDKGYLQGRIDGVMIKAHRAAHAIFYGEWPKGEIDHINRVKTDNRISNLREVSTSENCRNKAIQSNNSSGAAGVSQRKNGKWVARIKVHQKMYNLGTFETFDDALLARQLAEIQHGFGM